MFVRMCVMFFVDIGDHWRRLQGELFGSASMRPSVWRSVRYQWVCSSVPRAKCGHLWPSGAKMCYTVLLRFTKMGSTQRVSFRTCLLQSAFKSWSFQASWLIVSTAARTVEEDLVVSAQVPITSHNQILSLWFQDISRHFKPFWLTLGPKLVSSAGLGLGPPFRTSGLSVPLIASFDFDILW